MTEKIPTAPILKKLDQETFAAGWAHGWQGDVTKERIYVDEHARSTEAMTYRMGLSIAMWTLSMKSVHEATEN